ncbi:acyl carrier protein [Brevibacillus sp. HD1.4A]|uniref:acyl carrier protein n=1 Tax=Brevibacillus sp. HD1.4A TaxID=2738978 RepID=UPI00156AE45B|nr:acyl carrier protein [Brevibacillus sp. HD1.4A]NRQ56330.1 acyl carrier protein [Brevibacillus sp. HD1.4A]
MDKIEVEQKIIEYLVMLCAQDEDMIRTEYEENGDVEIDSLHFLILIGTISEDLGINITPADIDRFVKRSFKDFCSLVESLINGNR